jgi:hypothetical protein
MVQQAEMGTGERARELHGDDAYRVFQDGLFIL